MKPSILEVAGLKSTTFVAEVKLKSPFGFESDHNWDELTALARLVGDIVSVHIDARWGGEMDNINKMKHILGETKFAQPILAKGLINNADDVHDCLQRGASYVLVTNPDLLDQFEPGICWYELPYNKETIRQVKFKREHVYVYNARNIETGERAENNWDYVRSLHRGTLVQASFIREVDDIKRNADIIIVGEHLPDLVAELNDLIAADNKKHKDKKKKKKK